MKHIFTVVCFLSLFSCKILFDDKLNFTEGEYEKNLYERGKQEPESQMRLIDPIKKPKKISIIDNKFISISVTESTPIRDILTEISRRTEIDVQIDPSIIGSTIISAKKQPLRKILDRISEMNDLVYEDNDGMVIFKRDLPSVRTYFMDFLDIKRSSSGSIALSTSVISQTTGGSQANISTTSSDEFWTSVTDNIKQIISSAEGISKYYSDMSRDIMRSSMDLEDVVSDGVTNIANKLTNTTNDSSDNDFAVASDRIFINKRSGIMTITANHKAQMQVIRYLKDLKRKTDAQVLIEMKFLEVTLSKGFEAGINWQSFGTNTGNTLGLSTASSLGSGLSSTYLGSKDFNATLNAIETFGTTRVFNNPRVNAINNQPTMLTVADNEVYFKLEYKNFLPSSVGGTVIQEKQYTSAEPQITPIGIIMSVIPSIDLDNREVTLNVKPTISVLKGTVRDPAVQIATSTDNSGTDAAVENNVPKTAIRELDSILRIPDGGIMAVGGFTEVKNETSEVGVPFFRKIPFLGWLFKYRQAKESVVETVILIKVTIIDQHADLYTNYGYDLSLYKNFSSDPKMEI